MGRTVAHICILVADIDKAIEDYGRVFRTISPELVEGKVVKQERWFGVHDTARQRATDNRPAGRHSRSAVEPAATAHCPV